jgi:ADP-glucose pyrophosphorylase
LTNELVKLNFKQKKVHSSKKKRFSVFFSGIGLNLLCFAISDEIQFRCMKTDFDQRISQIPSFKQKVIFTAQKNVFVFQWNWLLNLLFVFAILMKFT